MILIDNYDSFTYNIVQYLNELGVFPRVIKNDEMSVEDLKKLNFNSILISPGPGNPDEAGICMEVIDKFKSSKKILGVCLGFQCICQYYGAKIIKDSEPMHGKVSKIKVVHKSKLFENIPQEFLVTRYHSLMADFNTVNAPLKISALTCDKNIIMGIEHESLPIYGVQFHPEAILTEYGHDIFRNFIQI